MADIRDEIDSSARQRLLQQAMNFVDEGRTIACRALATGFQTEHKADRTLVTSVDREIEQRLRAQIAREFPDHGVVGEEFPPLRPDSPFQWILDPIDGTEEFAHGVPTFGIILGLHYRGQPLLGIIDHPALERRVSAAYGHGTWYNGRRVILAPQPEEDLPGGPRLVLSARWNFVRHVDDGPLFESITRAYPNHRIYRACYAHTCVITGAADAIVDMHNAVWDLAASQILIEEAGGKYVVARKIATPDGGRYYSAVFGKPRLVDRLLGFFEARAPARGNATESPPSDRR